MNTTIRDKIARSSKLPSLPSVAIEVLRLCQQERTQAEELGEVLSQDPALAAKVLKLANSPFFGLRNDVATVSHAVVMLGMVSVRTIALGFSLVKGLSNAAPRGFAHREYWARSLVSATAARVLTMAGATDATALPMTPIPSRQANRFERSW